MVEAAQARREVRSWAGERPVTARIRVKAHEEQSETSTVEEPKAAAPVVEEIVVPGPIKPVAGYQ